MADVEQLELPAQVRRPNHLTLCCNMMWTTPQQNGPNHLESCPNQTVVKIEEMVAKEITIAIW